MMQIVQDILNWLNEIAPFSTAESFDNVGLLIGENNCEVSDILFCLDVTPDILNTAKTMKAPLIIAHHPIIFQGIKRLSFSTVQTECLTEILKHKINVIGMHTNWDKAIGGVADSLAEILNLTDIKPLDEYARMGKLPVPLSLSQFSKKVENILNAPPRCYGNPEKIINTVVVGPGAYGEAVELAVNHNADGFVVGEIHHHQILERKELCILDAGHFATEWPGVQSLYNIYLQNKSFNTPAHLFIEKIY